jgi:heme exporter protein C
MKKNWWKALAFLLLAYTVWMGLGTPLSPGVVNVTSSSLASGDTISLVISGYNTRFSAAENKVWLRTQSQTRSVDKDFHKAYVYSFNVKAIDETTLKATVYLPNILPGSSIDLFVNNDLDGTMMFRNAFFALDVLEAPINIGEAPVVSNIDENYFSFPFQNILYETIRNLNFHVTMWFTMMLILMISLWGSIKFLSKGDLRYDAWAEQAVNVGLLFAFLGLITGCIWAKYTWGAWWVNDTKLNGAAVTTLIYLAYKVLRSAVNDDEKRARLAAVYNIFAYAMLLVFIMVLPRMTDSLHPGNGGNPAFSSYDLDDNLRMVFYPAVIGWFLLGYWILNIQVRVKTLTNKLADRDENMA